MVKTFIHPSAIVEPGAQIGEGCHIGPFCYIGPHVKMGRDNFLAGWVSIGTQAEHRDYFRSEPGPVIIGDGNNIREFVTINGGTNSATVIENGCSFLKSSHVGHDAIVRSGANLACSALVGGHSIIGQGANLGLNVSVHQYRTVGAYTMVGMNSAVARNMPPFLIAIGSPARAHRVNRVGLTRAGVAENELASFEQWFQLLEESGAMNPILHPLNKLLAQYLTDVQSFQQSFDVSGKKAAA